MRYSAAVAYLDSFLNFERIPFEYRRQFNLKRIHLLLRWFDSPQFLFPSVLVAGTKGKGSTANFLSHIVKTNGYQVGLYTSPHLIDPRERIRVNGRAISKNDFSRLVSKIRSVVGRGQKEIKSIEPITYFEIFTLLAILYFADQRIDLGIFEVGMGGRLDATNVLHPLISIITSISYDHEEHLGYTLKSIAGEKAAIIKRKGCVVSADQPAEAEQVIKAEIKGKKAKGYFYGEQFWTFNEKIFETGATFDFGTISPSTTSYRDRSDQIGLGRPVPPGNGTKGIQIPLAGRHQIKNAALALETTHLLGKQFNFNEDRTKAGLKKAFWPGRFERVNRLGRTFILDGAHNGASMKELGFTLKYLYNNRPVAVIFGTSREKKLTDQLKPLLSVCKTLIATKSHNPRAQEPKVILETAYQLKLHQPTFMAGNLAEAIKITQQVSRKDSVVVVTGSLFLVGEAREILKCPKFI